MTFSHYYVSIGIQLSRSHRPRNNKLVYIYCRLTIKSICPMELKQYPLDTQTCKIIIGSCKYYMYYIISSYLSECIIITVLLFTYCFCCYYHCPCSRQMLKLTHRVQVGKVIGFFNLSDFFSCRNCSFWTIFALKEEFLQT